MRILGYILLVVGFLFLAALQVMSKQAALAAIMQQRQHLSKEVSFTPQQVDEAVYQAAFDTRKMLSSTAAPAAVMLCGGILLDRANRRRRDS